MTSRIRLFSIFSLLLALALASAWDPMSGWLLTSAMTAPAMSSNSLAQALQYASRLSNDCQDSMLEGRYAWLPDDIAAAMENRSVSMRMSTFYGKPIELTGWVGAGRIAALRCGRNASADYDVQLGMSEAIGLASADEPVGEFLRLEKEGRITLQARGEGNAQRLQALREQVAREQNASAQTLPESIGSYFKSLGRALGWG